MKLQMDRYSYLTLITKILSKIRARIMEGSLKIDKYAGMFILHSKVSEVSSFSSCIGRPVLSQIHILVTWTPFQKDPDAYHIPKTI